MKAWGSPFSREGRNPGRGTANLIVPFGEQYLELLAVVDEVEAALDRIPHSRCRGVDVGRFDHRARPGPAVSDAPDGTTISWRSVVVDRAWAEPWRCAFMNWDDPGPARSVVAHPDGATGFARLDVVVPNRPVALVGLGGHEPRGVVLEEGPQPRIRGPLLSSPAGEIPVE